MNNRTLIAMSGGVDSSVAAYLTKKNGFDSIGITLKLFDSDTDEISEKTCCSLDDVEDARAVANKLGIPYYVLNFKSNFHENVIKRFVDAYTNGCTPNPCIDCNKYIKFLRLMDKAKETDCDHVVTGHYARIEKDGGRFLLKKAVDKTKDQTYVLYSLTQEQLTHTMFPLGSLTKTQVRELAAECGFVNAAKKDSQDICFVPDGDYAGFIEKYTKKQFPHGDFIDANGNVIGTHSGIIRYTIGQRKGLGVSFGKPVYVCDINSKNNTVTLGDNESLFSKSLIADEINLIACDRLDKPTKLSARIRYSQKEQPARIEQIDETHLRVDFDEPQRAVTRGQAIVIYDGDTVVGGGRIA
ncbi:MAG: tRNA 2-thiouridine(34) synthase MnmA, partial [Oscillospiraceae bacterium]|nr:tRNA 2-thiouridine(34) synthase MnmA [Oscillospiraceae bacterium]